MGVARGGELGQDALWDPPPLSCKSTHGECANTLGSGLSPQPHSPCLTLAFCWVGISVLGAMHWLAGGSCNTDDNPPHSKGLLCHPHQCTCCHLADSLPLLSLLVLKADGRLQTTYPQLCSGLAEVPSPSPGAGPASVGSGRWWREEASPAGPRGRDSSGQMCRQGRRDRGSFSFPPCRWRRAWKQCWAAGLWGAQGASPKPFGKNKLFAPSLGRQEHLCWHPSLGWGVLGARSVSSASWVLGLRNLTIYLKGRQSLLGPFPG